MEQMLETGTNSPDICCNCQFILRGRLVAAPTNGWCDKQQFTTLLSQTEKHKIFLEFLQGVSLLHPFLCYT